MNWLGPIRKNGRLLSRHLIFQLNSGPSGALIELGTISTSRRPDMNISTPYSVSAHELTDEAFAPFGDIIKPRRSGDQGDRAYAYRPGQEKNHVELVAGSEPMIRVMHQFKRGLEFNIVARHLRVTQCLGSLQGK